jgi:hypothetical protein
MRTCISKICLHRCLISAVRSWDPGVVLRMSRPRIMRRRVRVNRSAICVRASEHEMMFAKGMTDTAPVDAAVETSFLLSEELACQILREAMRKAESNARKRARKRDSPREAPLPFPLHLAHHPEHRTTPCMHGLSPGVLFPQLVVLCMNGLEVKLHIRAIPDQPAPGSEAKQVEGHLGSDAQAERLEEREERRKTTRAQGIGM